VLPSWCDQHQFRSSVFVTNRDHSRRLRRVLDRPHPDWRPAGAHERVAELELAAARNIVNGRNTEVEREAFVRLRDEGGFTSVSAAKAARERAEAQRKVLHNCKAWVQGLLANVRLVLQYPSSKGADLGAIRKELKELRESLRQLTGNPPASPDIGSNIDAYVVPLAAEPVVWLLLASMPRNWKQLRRYR
jgi:hypothetical protein